MNGEFANQKLPPSVPRSGLFIVASVSPATSTSRRTSGAISAIATHEMHPTVAMIASRDRSRQSVLIATSAALIRSVTASKGQ